MSEEKYVNQSPAEQPAAAEENILFTPEATSQNEQYGQPLPSESNPYAQTYPTSAGYGQPYGAPSFEQFTVEEVPWSSKNKLAAGLFGILLGALGVHNFYLGYTGKGVAQLLITILSFGMLSWVSAIWGLVEGILILASEVGSKWDLDALGRPMRPVGQTGF